MAKKIVRGITDVKNINNQDFDTNNVNDLLSDGQYNYIHRKKGKNEEYHNLTDNIKTISSDNTELLSVTNYNKTTNTALLSPKHDAQKEQVLESTRNTIAITHGANGTAEKTTVDTNPQKVLEHENLISDSEYITLQHQTDEATTHIQTAALKEELTNLHQTKQDTLVAGDGITIEGQTISATGGGTTHTIQEYYSAGEFRAYKQVVTSEHVVTSEQGTLKTLKTLKTFVFESYGQIAETAEHVITGELKEELENYVYEGDTISNGAISITYDGTTMKLINSAPSRKHYPQGTFTFYEKTVLGGGDEPSVS